MIPYNFNYRIADIDMAKGRNKKGEEYDRKLGAKNGMAELVNIVAGLQKDVKRINSCLTLAGATAYATKKGPNWQAHEADITGPHGKPDGFKEVFVTDANGNIKVINGYTLAKSTYPERKAYWTVQPTNPETNAPYADRDGNPIEFRMPFSKFRKQLYEISPNVNENGAPYYAKDFDDAVLHIILETSMMNNLQILDMQSNQKMLSKLLYSTQYTMQIENKLKLLMHQQC